MQSGEPYALRLDMAAAVARAGALTWAETGAGPHGETGLVRAEPAAWGDVVLGRKETPASYHLAVVLDDALQGVTQVVRGQDLFWSTSIHRLLQALLGLPSPRYHHHRLVLDAEGRKLAKSTGSTALRDLRAAGATPADIRAMIGVNQLSLMGMVPAPAIWHSVTRGRQGTDAEEAQVRSQEAAGAPCAAPAACVCPAGTLARNGAGRARPRCPHAAHRHSRAQRVARRLRTAGARARLGEDNQEHRRAPHAADLAHRRRSAQRRQRARAAAGIDAPAPARRSARRLARRTRRGEGPRRGARPRR